MSLKIADDKLRGRGFVTGVADRDFNDLNKFYSIAHRQDINLQDKVELIKEQLKSMVPYVLEKLILQSDMGFFGKYDPRIIDYNYIKKRTAYKRLKLGLDVYDAGTPEQLRDVERMIRELLWIAFMILTEKMMNIIRMKIKLFYILMNL